MPFVLDFAGLAEPPAKRRKLTSPRDMARYSLPSYDDAGTPPTERENDSGKGVESQQEVDTEYRDAPIRTSDREELIQCIKRGQRPTWVPKPGLEALCAEVNAEHNGSSSNISTSWNNDSHMIRDSGPRQESDTPTTSPIPLSATDALRRSLSALHTSDTPEDARNVPWKLQDISPPRRQASYHAYSSSPSLWPSESPPAASPSSSLGSSSHILRRSRAPSLGSSLSSSFVMRIPTSPLVHATNNPTLDFSPRDSQSSGTSRAARRRTMPPNAFESSNLSPSDAGMPNYSRPFPHSQLQREGSSFPLGHRPRRSLSSFTYQSVASAQSFTQPRPRRPSLAADASPRQRASMVGSFEESILRGRMSTPPSKPLDFVAQIGVLGKGNCPQSLKCPAHVTVPFPAVFYNYPSATPSRSISDDNPSPYVGTIDLERNLKPPELPARRPRRSQADLDPETLAAEITSPENTAIGRALAREAREKKNRGSTSPKVPLGGAYRVPQKGQLQIIIKNPNKTAVKLFLVPYDLEGMPPGTKTFVRQRSFSSGPILETAMSDKHAAPTARDPLRNKEILRYLIHLKFCSTTKGRFYLYDNIRVVFANRMPDDKEKLKNELQLPEPRFSAYKPILESGSQSPTNMEEAFTPHSHLTMSPEFAKLDDILGSMGTHNRPAIVNKETSIPFRGPPRSTFDTDGARAADPLRNEDEMMTEVERTVSPIPGFVPSTSSRSSPVPWRAHNGSSVVRGFSPPTVEAGHGLISQKLRELKSNGYGPDE